MTSALTDYIAAHTTPADDYLKRLYRATWLHLLYPRMASGQVQGQLLKMLAQLVNPRTVVEVGTYSGYSALAMASGMAAGSQVLTFEKSDEQAAFTRPWLEGAPYAAKVKMFVGDVSEWLPKLKPRIDMAYIDANKREYISYYDALMPYTHSGSLIIADNTLWDGHVADPLYDNDAQTQGIRAFNDHVSADPRVEQAIIEGRDGLTVIRAK